MKKVVLLLVLLAFGALVMLPSCGSNGEETPINQSGMTPGWFKVNFVNKSLYPSFEATVDTNWDKSLSAAYFYEYTVKWEGLNADDSYMSIYLGGDPDNDGILDWVLEDRLEPDSLQLTGANGIAKIRSVSLGVISDGIRLHYNHGGVSSGVINLELNLVKKPTE